jgi:hypothetical protein
VNGLSARQVAELAEAVARPPSWAKGSPSISNKRSPGDGGGRLARLHSGITGMPELLFSDREIQIHVRWQAPSDAWPRTPGAASCRSADGHRSAVRTRGAPGQPERVTRGGRRDCSTAQRSAPRRRNLDRRTRQRPSTDRPGHPGGRALQRPGGGPAHPTGNSRQGRHGRQVPGPGSSRRHLLNNHIDDPGDPAGHGVPLQSAPPERRDLPSSLPRRPGRQCGPVDPTLPDSTADTARQCPTKCPR